MMKKKKKRRRTTVGGGRAVAHWRGCAAPYEGGPLSVGIWGGARVNQPAFVYQALGHSVLALQGRPPSSRGGEGSEALLSPSPCKATRLVFGEDPHGWMCLQWDPHPCLGPSSPALAAALQVSGREAGAPHPGEDSGLSGRPAAWAALPLSEGPRGWNALLPCWPWAWQASAVPERRPRGCLEACGQETGWGQERDFPGRAGPSHGAGLCSLPRQLCSVRAVAGRRSGVPRLPPTCPAASPTPPRGPSPRPRPLPEWRSRLLRPGRDTALAPSWVSALLRPTAEPRLLTLG